LQVYKDKVFQDILVDRVVFYQSTLTTKGALYRPIKTFSLK
jgi:2'-5' RNA ligase